MGINVHRAGGGGAAFRCVRVYGGGVNLPVLAASPGHHRDYPPMQVTYTSICPYAAPIKLVTHLALFFKVSHTSECKRLLSNTYHDV